MRTASMVLGIVGGAIALILAIVLFIGSSFVAAVPWSEYNNFDWNYSDSSGFDWSTDSSDSSDWEWNDSTSSDELNNLLDSLKNNDSDYNTDSLAEVPGVVQNMVGTVLLVPAICALIAGVLGLIGGIIVKKKNVAAGVLMIISAVLSLISFFNIISMALFIVGGVFALMRDRSKQQPVYAPPYPMPPNYVYPQQPYAPQPYTPPVYPPQPQQPAPPSENPPENPQP